MTRNKIDFTDRELYYLSLAIESHINSRDTYWTKKGAGIFNRMCNKIIAEGMNRKNPESILHPIVNFKEKEFNDEQQ